LNPPIPLPAFAFLMFAGMLILLEAGYRLRLNWRVKEAEAERSSLAPIEGGIFALFGLLMAFTFSGAASRFDAKRSLVGQEANAIETAYLRIEMLPSDTQPKLRELFREYVDSRLETYRRLPDLKAAANEMFKSEKLQDEIWTRAIAATKLPEAHPAAGWILPPALNNMIDITTTRAVALQTHPPTVIYGLLYCLALISSLLIGYRMTAGRRSWLHILGFTVMTVAVTYVMLDVEYPRAGLFRLDALDQFLIHVREHMH
jgi:hypothetical protein